jgi:hypothetical protein
MNEESRKTGKENTFSYSCVPAFLIVFEGRTTAGRLTPSQKISMPFRPFAGLI